ncbi:MAG: thiamine-binding protein [Bacteroidota bacterium]
MIINATIQVVPLTKIDEAFPIIDKAILMIQNSGLKYTVCAFETVIEGEYEPVQQLLRQVQDFCYSQNETQFLIYTKYHVCGGEHISADSKTSKFKAGPEFNL